MSKHLQWAQPSQIHCNCQDSRSVLRVVWRTSKSGMTKNSISRHDSYRTFTELQAINLKVLEIASWRPTNFNQSTGFDPFFVGSLDDFPSKVGPVFFCWGILFNGSNVRSNCGKISIRSLLSHWNFEDWTWLLTLEDITKLRLTGLDRQCYGEVSSGFHVEAKMLFMSRMMDKTG